MTDITVHSKLSKGSEWKVFVMPDFGHVKYIVPVGLGVLWVHDLGVNIPDRIVSTLNKSGFSPAMF